MAMCAIGGNSTSLIVWLFACVSRWRQQNGAVLAQLMRKQHANKPIFHATQLCEKARDKIKSARQLDTHTIGLRCFSSLSRLFPVTDWAVFESMLLAHRRPHFYFPFAFRCIREDALRMDSMSTLTQMIFIRQNFHVRTLAFSVKNRLEQRVAVLLCPTDIFKFEM